jgi:hypothetical protein
MCQAPGQTTGGREAEQNRLEEEERGRVRCAGLLGIALDSEGGTSAYDCLGRLLGTLPQITSNVTT